MFDKKNPYKDQKVLHKSHTTMGAKCDGLLEYKSYKDIEEGGVKSRVIAHECKKCGFFPLTIIQGEEIKVWGEDSFYED